MSCCLILCCAGCIFVLFLIACNLISYNEIQKQLSVEWRQMGHADKQIWTDKANEVKRQLQEYNSSLAAQGVSGDRITKKGDLRKVKKGIALPKGPR